MQNITQVESSEKTFGQETKAKKKRLSVLPDKRHNLLPREIYGMECNTMQNLVQAKTTEKKYSLAKTYFHRMERGSNGYRNFINMIVWLCMNGEGYVYGSNEYFSEKLGYSTRTIERYFRRAVRERIIIKITEKMQDSAGRWISKRRAYLTVEFMAANGISLDKNRPTAVADITHKKAIYPTTYIGAPPPVHNFQQDKIIISNNKSLEDSSMTSDSKKTKNLSITLDRRSMSFVGILDEDRASWSAMSNNIDEELKKAALWLCNPEKASKHPKALKSNKSLRSFLNKWMSKCRNEPKVLSLDKKTGKFSNMDPEFIRDLEKRHPGVNVLDQIEEARKWLMKPENPERSNIRAFLECWIKNAATPRQKPVRQNHVQKSKISKPEVLPNYPVGEEVKIYDDYYSQNFKNDVDSTDSKQELQKKFPEAIKRLFGKYYQSVAIYREHKELTNARK